MCPGRVRSAAWSPDRSPRARWLHDRLPRCRWSRSPCASIGTQNAVPNGVVFAATASGISSSSSRCARHRQADLPAAVPGHEVDRLRRDLRRGHRQIAFVLAVLIVHDDEHAAGLDQRRRPPRSTQTARASSRPSRCESSSVCQSWSLPPEAAPTLSQLRAAFRRPFSTSSAARATYLPIMSHSRFTRSPARSDDRVVCAQVTE